MRAKLLISAGLIVVLGGAEPTAAALVVDGAQEPVAFSRLPDDLIQLAQVAGPSASKGGASTTTTTTTSTTSPGQASAPSTSSDVSTSDGGHMIIRTNLNWLITNKIHKDFAAAVTECGRYDPVYRIDCLRQNLDHLIRSMPSSGDYRQARQILERASRRLGAIVNKYDDPETPRLKPRSRANPRFLQNRSYRAVKRRQLGRALAEARQVIQEASTQLLRSSENSVARLAHYETMAVAVNSTKVLLRS
jgi:hypothetical protein